MSDAIPFGTWEDNRNRAVGDFSRRCHSEWLKIDEQTAAAGFAGATDDRKFTAAIEAFNQLVGDVVAWCRCEQENGSHSASAFTEEREQELITLTNRLFDEVAKKLGKSFQKRCDIHKTYFESRTIPSQFGIGRRQFRSKIDEPIAPNPPLPPLPANTADAYKQLLVEFRAAWCELADAWLVIEIFAPSTFSSDDPPFSPATHEVISSIHVPRNEQHTVFSLVGFATLPKCPIDNTLARRKFIELCRRAGSVLPSEFRTELADYLDWDVTNPAGAWIALLLHLSGEIARNADGTPRLEFCLGQPFLRCIDAIERCKLATDSPRIPRSRPRADSEIIGNETDGKLAELLELERTIPALDESSANWILGKKLASILRIVTSSLKNRRHEGVKQCVEGETFGLHNVACFWRKRCGKHPRYYLPRLREFARHLVNEFRDPDLSQLE